MRGAQYTAGGQPFASFTNHQQTPIMDDTYNTTSANANNEASQNLSALGTLIGYIGAEAATVHLFERLLWPQRFWNRLTLRKAVLMAIFMPMGGPLHKAALQTLDEFFAHGLFKGDRQGHMLGTAFFRDSELGYTVWAGGKAIEEEFVRNGLWIRALTQMEIPKQKEDPSVEAATAPPKRPLRAKTSLSHLILQNSAESGLQRRHVIENDTGSPSALVYACVFISELTGVLMGVIVAAIWQSWIAVLWFMPLLLKLLSTFWSLSREDLVRPTAPPSPSSSSSSTTTSSFPPIPAAAAAEEEPQIMYQVHHPHHGLFIIEGPPSIVLQFFRHYGHPVRARCREVLLFATTVGLGLVFPAGLVVSVLCMPTSMQYLWLSYQLYTMVAMYAYRYANMHAWGTTEEAIAARFDECRRRGEEEIVVLRGRDGVAVRARLAVTYYSNLGDAREAAAVMLRGAERGRGRASDSEGTVVDGPEGEGGEKAG